jgi:hypothetical protein
MSEATSLKKINLFVFAAHHLSSNIAAQRFKGLLKYLDPAKYRVFVFARQPAAETTTTTAAAPSDADIHIYPLPGHCVGSESPPAASLLILAAAFMRPLPFMLANANGRAASADTRPWLVHALAEADRLCSEKLAAGESCVAIGTYSPVDALIAAASLASKYRIGCLQDFRDGLVFEPLGKRGWLREWMRKLIERRVVATANLITSVSHPLVHDFQQRYPYKVTAMLPNGYDPTDFASLGKDAADDTRAAAILARHVPASKSLDYLVDTLNESAEVAADKHVMFVGELTKSELASLERARFSFSVLGQLERTLALRLMKRCDKLLLLTGSRASCATGKLFEYLATGADIVCISGVRNEATAILAETGAGQTLLTGQGVSGGDALRKALSPSTDAHRDIAAYSKVVQAEKLGQWISKMVQT